MWNRKVNNKTPNWRELITRNRSSLHTPVLCSSACHYEPAVESLLHRMGNSNPASSTVCFLPDNNPGSGQDSCLVFGKWCRKNDVLFPLNFLRRSSPFNSHNCRLGGFQKNGGGGAASSGLGCCPLVACQLSSSLFLALWRTCPFQPRARPCPGP